MTEYFYIDEIQNRQDGLANSVTTARSTLSGALSYYYERMSKLVASTEYVSFGLGLRTNLGRTIEPWALHDTAYAAPAETSGETAAE